MYSHQYALRVRYADTDQMGYVYYGKYASFYEICRVEALRALGITYKQLEEEEGIMMPVLVNHSEYLLPARYDELLTLRTYIDELPTVRIHFRYELFNEAGVLLHKGYTQLVFVNKQSGRPCRVPAKIQTALAPYFADQRA